MGPISREQIVEAARRASTEAGGPMSRADFQRITGIGQHHIYKLFPKGGWSEVKRLAGLDRHPKDMRPLDDNEMLEEYHRVASKIGDLPTWAVFDAEATISADVIRRRFGGLQGTLRRYAEWLNANDPESPMLERLNVRSRHELPQPPPVGSGNAAFAKTGTERIPSWDKVDGTEYGPPLDFRGLRHAPINEQGVVFLFGMVAYELGYIVEAVHASFPDCEAKRRVDAKGDRWQRVRIEFEFKSRSFQSHGHDPGGCDLIVCWEHDWAECPLEVLELRRVIDELDG